MLFTRWIGCGVVWNDIGFASKAGAFFEAVRKNAPGAGASRGAGDESGNTLPVGMAGGGGGSGSGRVGGGGSCAPPSVLVSPISSSSLLSEPGVSRPRSGKLKIDDGEACSLSREAEGERAPGSAAKDTAGEGSGVQVSAWPWRHDKAWHWVVCVWVWIWVSGGDGGGERAPGGEERGARRIVTSGPQYVALHVPHLKPTSSA